MEDEKKKKLIAKTINEFREDDAGDVIEFAVLLITNTWRLCGRTQRCLDQICEYVQNTLRPTMEHELEQMIINKVLNDK